MKALVDEIVVAAFKLADGGAAAVRGKEIIIEEIEEHVEADHIADIEIRDDRHRKGYGEKLEMTVIDEAFDAVGQKGQPDDRIDPHRVVRHNDGICREGVHHGDRDRDHFVGEGTRFLEIVGHRKTRESALDELDG